MKTLEITLATIILIGFTAILGLVGYVQNLGM